MEARPVLTCYIRVSQCLKLDDQESQVKSNSTPAGDQERHLCKKIPLGEDSISVSAQGLHFLSFWVLLCRQRQGVAYISSRRIDQGDQDTQFPALLPLSSLVSRKKQLGFVLPSLVATEVQRAHLILRGEVLACLLKCVSPVPVLLSGNLGSRQPPHAGPGLNQSTSTFQPLWFVLRVLRKHPGL